MQPPQPWVGTAAGCASALALCALLCIVYCCVELSNKYESCFERIAESFSVTLKKTVGERAPFPAMPEGVAAMVVRTHSEKEHRCLDSIAGEAQALNTN